MAVIGGGFVGLQTAVLAALSGVRQVIIVDIDPRVVDKINNTKDPAELHVKEKLIQENWSKVKDKMKATTDYKDASHVDVYMVSVQTPLLGDHVDYTPLLKVGESLGRIVDKGNLVISETTIYPGGTVSLLGRRISETSGLSLGSGGILLAHSPERVNPGSEWTAEKIPRVVGGIDIASRDAAVQIIRDCFGLTVFPVDDIRVAEASKLLENTFRLVNISLVNELQRRLDRKGINIRKVIEAASTKPFGYMPFWPGPGAGGSCLPKDARMLEEFTGSLLLRIAREINESQPLYYAARILREARKRNARRVLFYGLGYKPDTPYLVESPILHLIEELSILDPTLEIAKQDPLIPQMSDFDNIKDAIEWADLVLVWGKPPEGLTPEKMIDLRVF